MMIGNPMMLRELPIEDALARMAQWGFEGIEVCSPDVAKCGTLALKKQFADRVASFGLKLVRYNVAAADYFAPLERGKVPRAILDGLQRDIDTAAALGLNQLLTWEGRPSPAAGPADIHSWILEQTVSLFEKTLAYARQRDVRLSVEVHPFTLGVDLDFLIELCDRLDPDFFSVTYDCCHFGVGLPQTYINAIRKLGQRIKHVHFSDSDQRSSELHFPPGKGCLDLPGIVKALKEIEFKGSMMLDLWLYPLPIEGSKIGVPYLRGVMAELGLR